MAEGSDEIRAPFSVQIRLPPRDKPGMPHRRRMVNHPPPGWQPGQPSSTRPVLVQFLHPEAGLPEQFAKENSQNARTAMGVIVVMPDGSTIADPASPTGKLMAPMSDLRKVAVAGKNVRLLLQILRHSPEPGMNVLPIIAYFVGRDLGHGGKFDFQREGNLVTGYKQLRQFRDVSNFNVGLFCQQAGLTLDETLKISGGYAKVFSSNHAPGEPYGLDTDTKNFTVVGYEAGASGVFNGQ